jgi:hypothetical protein
MMERKMKRKQRQSSKMWQMRNIKRGITGRNRKRMRRMRRRGGCGGEDEGRIWRGRGMRG